MELHLFSSPGEGDIRYIVEAVKGVTTGKPGATLAYLPTANLHSNFLDYTVKTFMGIAEVNLIDVESMSFSEVEQVLSNASALYISGGNTYFLAYKLHQYNLVNLIREKVKGGLPLVAFSAGTIFAGLNILTTDDFNACGSTKFAGLELVPHNFVVHLPDDSEKQTEYDFRVKEYHIFYPNDVYALEDGTYFRVTNEKIELVQGNAWLYERGQERKKLTVNPDFSATLGKFSNNVSATPLSNLANTVSNVFGQKGTSTPPPPPPTANFSAPTPKEELRSKEDYEFEIQGLVDQLYEDEALRRGLTDEQAEYLLEWGAAWLKRKMPNYYSLATNNTELDQVLEDGRNHVRDTIQTVASSFGWNTTDWREQAKSMLAQYEKSPYNKRPI
jgi:dipeptidase E